MTNTNARIAGFMFLLLVLVAPFRLIHVPGVLFVAGDATSTVRNIAEHETLFRLGVFSDLLAGIFTLFVTLALYRLFADVDRRLAALVVILGGILPTAIYFFNVVNDAAALLFVRAPDFLSVFDQPQRDALAMLFLKLHGQTIGAAMVFWGLWLLPLAGLILRSGFLPRFLGWWLVLNALAYLAQSVTWSLLPRFDDLVTRIAFPLQFGEVALMLWLLLFGARRTLRSQPATFPTASA